MASRDKKPSKPSTSRTGRIRTLADLNRPPAVSDSDSDSDAAQEYFTGGGKSGMLVQDPSKANEPPMADEVDAIFAEARKLVAKQAAMGKNQPSSSSSSFKGTGRRLSSESPPSSPRRPESVVHNIVFWRNGFTVDDGPLRSMNGLMNTRFLESIKNSECPTELEPPDRRTSVLVNLVRKDEDRPEPEVHNLPFQGVGRTIGGSSAPSTAVAAPPTAPPPPPAGLVVDKSLPTTSIQLRLADGTRIVADFNHHHAIADIRSFINASRPGGSNSYHLQTVGFPPTILSDLTQTVEQAGLLNSVVVQRL